MPKLMRVINREQCIGCYSCMSACSRTWENALTVEKSAMRVKNYPGVEGAFSIRVCYGCIEPDCAAACPTGALTPRDGGGVKLEKSRCTNCGACIKACVPRALQWDLEELRPIVCNHCGICVAFCPNNVLALVEVER